MTGCVTCVNSTNCTKCDSNTFLSTLGNQNCITICNYDSAYPNIWVDYSNRQC